MSAPLKEVAGSRLLKDVPEDCYLYVKPEKELLVRHACLFS